MYLIKRSNNSLIVRKSESKTVANCIKIFFIDISQIIEEGLLEGERFINEKEREATLLFKKSGK